MANIAKNETYFPLLIDMMLFVESWTPMKFFSENQQFHANSEHTRSQSKMRVLMKIGNKTRPFMPCIFYVPDPIPWNLLMFIFEQQSFWFEPYNTSPRFA